MKLAGSRCEARLNACDECSRLARCYNSNLACCWAESPRCWCPVEYSSDFCLLLPQGEPSVSQQLELSWQAQPDSRDASDGRQSPAQPAQPSSKRQQKRGVSSSAAAAAVEAPQAPAQPQQLVVGDKADCSDHQLLNSSSAAIGSPSLAMRRAARRHTDQGRVQKQRLARPEKRRQLLQKAGPAEAFLATLQERLYNARNSKCAFVSTCVGCATL